MSVIYRITELGVSQRGGMNAAVEARIGGVAKTNAESEFTIANEVIAARIGQVLGLPVPAGVIAEDSAKTLYYLSIDVSREGKSLPPVMAADFCAAEPWLAAGIAAFDVLIANGDRNATNLSRDPAFTPPRVSVFDHGHALFGTSPPIGRERLELAADRLGCIDDDAHIATDSVLVDQPLDCASLREWAERIAQIPSYVFGDICREIARAPELGINSETADWLANWLAARAPRVGNLIWQNQNAFPAVEWALWGPGETPQ
jgi:hypothetical protein